MTRTIHGDELAAHVGEELGASGWQLVDQARVDAFADVTGDHQWIHVDTERAKDGPYGTTIAHGFLTLSLLPALLGGVFQVDGVARRLNYGMDRVRFPSPVPTGSRLRLVVVLASVEEVPGDGVQIAIDGTIEIEGAAKPACVVRMLTRAYRGA